jgi:hypothetical protein
METVLHTDGAQVKIRFGGPAVVIGEKINPTGRKKLAAALEARGFALPRRTPRRFPRWRVESTVLVTLSVAAVLVAVATI